MQISTISGLFGELAKLTCEIMSYMKFTDLLIDPALVILFSALN